MRLHFVKPVHACTTAAQFKLLSSLGCCFPVLLTCSSYLIAHAGARPSSAQTTMPGISELQGWRATVEEVEISDLRLPGYESPGFSPLPQRHFPAHTGKRAALQPNSQALSFRFHLRLSPLHPSPDSRNYHMTSEGARPKLAVTLVR